MLFCSVFRISTSTFEIQNQVLVSLSLTWIVIVYLLFLIGNMCLSFNTSLLELKTVLSIFLLYRFYRVVFIFQVIGSDRILEVKGNKSCFLLSHFCVWISIDVYFDAFDCKVNFALFLDSLF